ncbi:MAG: hypothetical protein IPP17_24705 [Bacteroidetes bacterium]|nr:hypothetical protein [Bacteroidota bacterium]
MSTQLFTLKYSDLYTGIDLEYTFHASEGIKYSLTVKPGANAADIALKFREWRTCFWTVKAISTPRLAMPH